MLLCFECQKLRHPHALSARKSYTSLLLDPAVNPGFGGQKFIEYQVEKVRKLRQMCDDAGANPWIEVDGGISGKNAYKVMHTVSHIVLLASACSVLDSCQVAVPGCLYRQWLPL